MKHYLIPKSHYNVFILDIIPACTMKSQTLLMPSGSLKENEEVQTNVEAKFEFYISKK